MKDLRFFSYSYAAADKIATDLKRLADLQCPLCIVWFHMTCAGIYGKAYFDCV